MLLLLSDSAGFRTDLRLQDLQHINSADPGWLNLASGRKALKRELASKPICSSRLIRGVNRDKQEGDSTQSLEIGNRDSIVIVSKFRLTF